MRKLFAAVTSISMAVMVAAPAGAATLEELQTQLTALLAQVQALQSQITAMGGTVSGVPAACTGVSFTVNLSQGSTGAAVKCLQALLNQSADTQVAASGVGSSGNETTYFGPLTKAAAVKYQEKYAAEILTPLGLTAGTGFVGPSTRSKLNAVLSGAVPAVTPGVTPGVSPVPTTGGEGTFTIVLSASPVSRTVNGGLGIEVYGVDVTAYGSDINIGAIDLQVNVATAAIAQMNPGNLISAIKIYDDSISDANLKKTFSSPVFTLDTAGVYFTQLTGLNFVVPVSTTKKVLIVMDTSTAFDNNRIVTVQVYGNGVRGTDGLGINRWLALGTQRVITVQRPGNAVLTMSVSGSNPDSNNVYADATVGVQTPQPIVVFNAKATAGDATLTRLAVTYNSAASDAVPSIFYLYSGETLVASAAPGAAPREQGTAVFENFRLPIGQDTTKTLTIKAAWNALADSSINRLTPWIRVQALGVGTNTVFERADGSVVGATIAAQMNGNQMWLHERGVKYTFVSASASVSPSTQPGLPTVASSVVKFKVEPFGGTMTQLTVVARISAAAAGAVFADPYWGSGSGIAVAASAPQMSVVRSISQSPARNLSEGEVGEVTVNTTVSCETSYCDANSVRFKLEGIEWTVGGLARSQGETCGGSGGSGNLTDNWFTNWVYMP